MSIAMAVEELRHGWLKSLWIPTSMAVLAGLEQKILSTLKASYICRFVSLKSNSSKRIWTVIFNKDKHAVPLVMVHGFGGGLGMWVKNIDSLAKNRPVYTFDLLGFARSARTPFSSEEDQVEQEFVESIEEWRSQLNLDKFVLLGHSFGAYLASLYALKYPHRVHHLILADPWGYPAMPPASEIRISPAIKCILVLVQRFGPLSPMRAMGPLGPRMVGYFRSDLKRKYASQFDDNTMVDYIYHCNAGYPSGEQAFKSLAQSMGWAKNPMLFRIEDLDSYVPITFLYGGKSWINSSPGEVLKERRENCFVDVQVIGGAGHHLYADQPEAFNLAVNAICADVDASRPPRIQHIPSLRNLRRLEQARSAQDDSHDEQEVLGDLAAEEDLGSPVDKLEVSQPEDKSKDGTQSVKFE